MKRKYPNGIDTRKQFDEQSRIMEEVHYKLEVTGKGAITRGGGRFLNIRTSSEIFERSLYEDK